MAAEPGMVLSFEAAYDVKVIGGFKIEDQLLIIENEVVVIAASSRDLTPM